MKPNNCPMCNGTVSLRATPGRKQAIWYEEVLYRPYTKRYHCELCERTWTNADKWMLWPLRLTWAFPHDRGLFDIRTYPSGRMYDHQARLVQVVVRLGLVTLTLGKSVRGELWRAKKARSA